MSPSYESELTRHRNANYLRGVDAQPERTSPALTREALAAALVATVSIRAFRFGPFAAEPEPGYLEVADAILSALGTPPPAGLDPIDIEKMQAAIRNAGMLRSESAYIDVGVLRRILGGWTPAEAALSKTPPPSSTREET